MNYKKTEPLESIEKNDITNSSNFEKIKLLDEDINKKNLSIVRYRPGINTDNMSKVLFVDTKEETNIEQGDINSEKYNTAPRSKVAYGSKVYNNVTKNDMMNEMRISDTTFTI